MTWRSEPAPEYLERAKVELARGERPYCTVRVFSGERVDFRGHRCGNRVPQGETNDLRCKLHQGAEAREAARREELAAQAEERQARERLAAARVGSLPPQLNAKAEYIRGMGYNPGRVVVDVEALMDLLSERSER